MTDLSVIAAFIFYVIPAIFIIWFMVNLVSLQRERNLILRDILEKMKTDNKINHP